ALGEGAQAVEATGNGRQEALFALHVRSDWTKERCMNLVGPVGATEALDGGVSLPATLEKIMHAASLVLGRSIGMIRASGPASLAEHDDRFAAVHEGRGFVAV